MNIYELFKLHKAQKYYNYKIFKECSRFTPTQWKQGYKQRLDYLLVVTLKQACLVLLSNQSKKGGGV